MSCTDNHIYAALATAETTLWVRKKRPPLLTINDKKTNPPPVVTLGQATFLLFESRWQPSTSLGPAPSSILSQASHNIIHQLSITTLDNLKEKSTFPSSFAPYPFGEQWQPHPLLGDSFNLILAEFCLDGCTAFSTNSEQIIKFAS